MIWLLVLPALLLIGLLVVDFQISAPGYEGPKSDHFDGTQFHNPDKIRGRGLLDMAKLALTSEQGHWDKLAAADISYSKLPPQQPEQNMRVTFINHTSFLLQMNGLNILTDPVWSTRVSPYSWVGPKRVRPPGLRFEDLPAIDGVLLSHNHYDHLDIHTLQRLNAAHDPMFVMPLGVEKYLNTKGMRRTVEFDWWDKYELRPDVAITAVPAQHFSGRGVFDRDQTLWCGYVIETTAGTLYFAGDTAYGSFFTDIGGAFDIDLSLIPIGAYKPRWFMRTIHTDPDEAVQIHQDVGSRQSIASHFGTFPLANEARHEPLDDLAQAIKTHGLSPNEFITLTEGEPFSYQPRKRSLGVAGE